MKKIFVLILLTSVYSFFMPSCEKGDTPMNPEKYEMNGENPEFYTNVKNDTIWVDKEGGNVEVTVVQNTNYRWIVQSNENWISVDVPENDTISGDKTFHISIDLYNAVDPREAKVAVKEVSPKTNRELSIVVIQSGAKAEINVDNDKIETDALGGQYEVTLTSNGATWNASTTESWISVSPSSGQNETVTITVAKNVEASTPERSGTVDFEAGGASISVNVSQIGYTSCNSANNTSTIYFDEFAPCSNASTGDTWTLTDRRDEKTYLVKLLEDGHYWMIEDLRFGGDPDVVEDKDVFSNDDYSQDASIGERIPGLFGDIVNHTSHGGSAVQVRQGRGYFYNWRAAMQQADIASVGNSLEKSQGIAPAGWHIPSRSEFEALRDKIGEDGIAWGEDASSIWNGIWGGAVDPGMSHWGRWGNYGSYWTSTEISDHQACAWCIEAPGQSGPNANSKIEDPIVPGVAIPWKQTKSSAALIRCVKNY